MGNCLGSSSKQKAPPKQPVVTTPQATYPPPMQQQLQPYNAPPIHQPHAPMQQSHSSYNAPPIHQPYAPIQQSRIPMQQPYSLIQQSHIPPPPPPIQRSHTPIQRSHTPMQQMYTPPVQRPYSQVQQSSLTYKALPPINAQFNDQSPAINHLQSPQTPNPDHGLNPTVPSANVEVVSDSKVLAQYITKTNQNFEDYGIDDPIERNLQPPPKDAFCLNCQDGKVDTDPDGFPGEYCSNECRKDAISGGFGNSPCVQCKEFPQVTNSQFCGWKNCRNLPLCINCKAKEAYPCSLWCSKTCRDQTPNWQRLVNERSNEMCLYCKRENALAGYDFCSDDCEASIKKKTPCLLRLPSGGQKYKDITNQFNAAWKHPHKVVPEITSIWKIYCSDHLNKRYNIYRDEVENHHKLAGNPFPKGDGKRKMSAGNEQRRFHGTKTSCYLGLTNDANICGDPACSVCCIIKEGYKLRFVGTGTISAAFQRFGRGIYFSGTSSKSDDYNEGSLKYFQGSNYKVMIMNKVVVGQGYPLTKDNMKLTEPPPGFNSILGEPSKTGNLNYDEVVVYREEASIPQYLIVYKVK